MDGTKIKKYLIEKGVKLSDLAEKIKIKPPTLQKRFSAKMSLEFLLEIQQHTGISIAELIKILYPDRREDFSIVAEPEEKYNATPSDLQKEILEVYRENRALHKEIVAMLKEQKH